MTHFVLVVMIIKVSKLILVMLPVLLVVSFTMASTVSFIMSVMVVVVFETSVDWIEYEWGASVSIVGVMMILMLVV